MSKVITESKVIEQAKLLYIEKIQQELVTTLKDNNIFLTSNITYFNNSIVLREYKHEEYIIKILLDIKFIDGILKINLFRSLFIKDTKCPYLDIIKSINFESNETNNLKEIRNYLSQDFNIFTFYLSDRLVYNLSIEERFKIINSYIIELYKKEIITNHTIEKRINDENYILFDCYFTLTKLTDIITICNTFYGFKSLYESMQGTNLKRKSL